MNFEFWSLEQPLQFLLGAFRFTQHTLHLTPFTAFTALYNPLQPSTPSHSRPQQQHRIPNRPSHEKAKITLLLLRQLLFQHIQN